MSPHLCSKNRLAPSKGVSLSSSRSSEKFEELSPLSTMPSKFLQNSRSASTQRHHIDGIMFAGNILGKRLLSRFTCEEGKEAARVSMRGAGDESGFTLSCAITTVSSSYHARSTYMYVCPRALVIIRRADLHALYHETMSLTNRPVSVAPGESPASTGHSLPATAFTLSRAKHEFRLGSTLKLIMHSGSSLIVTTRRQYVYEWQL